MLAGTETHKSRSASIDLEAFDTLASLTLAPDELHILHQQDKAEALRELVKQLEIAWERVATTATLVSKLESAVPWTEASDDILTTLLEKAGGTLGLTEASERLGISRQALHKKVYAGNALGMMHGDSDRPADAAEFVAVSREGRKISSRHRPCCKGFPTKAKLGPSRRSQFPDRSRSEPGSPPHRCASRMAASTPSIWPREPYLSMDEGLGQFGREALLEWPEERNAGARDPSHQNPPKHLPAAMVQPGAGSEIRQAGSTPRAANMKSCIPQKRSMERSWKPCSANPPAASWGRVLSRERSWSTMTVRRPLQLAKLYDDGLLWHGTDAGIGSSDSYTEPRKMAVNLHSAFTTLDGIAWRARHDDEEDATRCSTE